MSVLTARRKLSVLLAGVALLGACTNPGGDGSPSPSPTPSGNPTTPAPTPSPTAACEPFGTTEASVSSDDWASQLRTDPTQALWGVTMRVGTHECYDRFTFEFDGVGDMPGWRVLPVAGSQFTLDPSDMLLTPPLAGTAALELDFAAWYDGSAAIDEPAFGGPEQILPTQPRAIEEVRILGAFEGLSQIGIGLDEARPYRVTWLEGPKRLVVDVYVG